MHKRILLVTGGSGGHVYPAEALAQQLSKKNSEVQTLFVGGGLEENPFFDQERYPWRQVASDVFSGRNPWRHVKSAFRIAKGVCQSVKILREYRPDAVVGFGSFHTLPTVLTAALTRVPVVLHEANSYPGRVNRLLSPFVRVTGTHFPETADYLKGKTVEVGMPLREEYNLALASKDKARIHFGLDPNKFTFLVFGGSQGAVTINALFSSAVTDHLARRTTRYQVIHTTGDVTLPEEMQRLYESRGIAAYVKNFEPRMDLAWQAADLLVARAGASTIAEQMAMEVPGVLIPYRYAGGHQQHNADFMASTVGGAVQVAETEVDAERLGQLITELVADDQKRLKEMRQSICRYKQEVRRRDLCSVVCEVAGIDVR